MKFYVFCITMFLSACNSNSSKRAELRSNTGNEPAGYNQINFNNPIDFTNASGHFLAIRYDSGTVFPSKFIDTMHIVIKSGVVAASIEDNGDVWDENVKLNSEGIGISDEFGPVITKVIGVWTENVNNVSTVEFSDTDGIGEVPTGNEIVETNTIPNSEPQNISPTNEYQAPKKEIFYYKVSYDKYSGARAFKCTKSDNSAGESCHEVGSLPGYGKCNGALIWDRGNSLGAVVWTNDKVFYQGYEGYDHGGRTLFEVKNPNQTGEVISYCQPQGNRLLIKTSLTDYYRE